MDGRWQMRKGKLETTLLWQEKASKQASEWLRQREGERERKITKLKNESCVAWGSGLIYLFIMASNEIDWTENLASQPASKSQRGKRRVSSRNHKLKKIASFFIQVRTEELWICEWRTMAWRRSSSNAMLAGTSGIGGDGSGSGSGGGGGGKQV